MRRAADLVIVKRGKISSSSSRGGIHEKSNAFYDPLSGGAFFVCLPTWAGGRQQCHALGAFAFELEQSDERDCDPVMARISRLRV